MHVVILIGCYQVVLADLIGIQILKDWVRRVDVTGWLSPVVVFHVDIENRLDFFSVSSIRICCRRSSRQPGYCQAGAGSYEYETTSDPRRGGFDLKHNDVIGLGASCPDVRKSRTLRNHPSCYVLDTERICSKKNA